MIKKIIIASLNPVKINAVEQGFSRMFGKGKFAFEGISVPSGVEDQPMDDSTTFTGATNRVKNAMAKVQDADFWIGIEGGIEKTDQGEMRAYAWVIIKSKQNTGKAKTGTFYLPDEITRLIEEGKELGEADDIVFGHSNSKQKNGAVGILTDNAINRTDLYTQGVILGLIPFKQPQYFTPKISSTQE